MRTLMGFCLALLFLMACTRPNSSASQTETIWAPQVGETVWRSGHSVAGTTWMILRAEEERWLVSRFFAAPGRLQEHVGTESFATREQALHAVAEWNRQLGLLPTDSHTGRESLHEQAPRETDSVLWPVENRWSEEWEHRYAEWVRQNVDASFAERFQLATDCADLAFSVRWIFAYINKLPAANRLAGSGQLFSQDNLKAEWLQLPTAVEWNQNARFRAALNYLLENTYTHTLLRDSYPIRITPETLTPGTHHLAIHETSGHTMFVDRVQTESLLQPPVHLLFSNVPRIVRKLYESYYWEPEQPEEGKGGFLKMLWPEVAEAGGWTLRAPQSMAEFSLEQYGPDFDTESKEKSFAILVAERLLPGIDFVAVMGEGIKYLKELFVDRVSVVEKGYEVCQVQDCTPGTPTYDDWSTPSRDRRIAEQWQQLEEFATGPMGSMIPQVGQKWSEAQSDVVFELGGRAISLARLGLVWGAGFYSSDPRVSIDERWSVSGQGFGGGLTRRLSEALQSRSSIIGARSSYPCAGEVCSGADSFSQDERFSELSKRVEAFCEMAGEVDCGAMQNVTRTQSISVSGFTKSVEQWLKSVVWLNSSGKAPWSVRWGGLQDSLPHIELSANAQIQVGAAGGLLEFMPIIRRLRLFDRETHQLRREEFGVVSASLDLHSGAVVWIHQTEMATGREVVVLDPNFTEVLREPVDAVLKASWHGSKAGQLFLYSAGYTQWRHVFLGGISAPVTWSASPSLDSEAATGVGSNWLAPPLQILLEKERGIILDLSGEAPTEVSFSIPAATDDSDAVLRTGFRLVTSDAAVVSVSLCKMGPLGGGDCSGQEYFYDRKERKLISGDVGPIWVASDGSEAICLSKFSDLHRCTRQANGDFALGELLFHGSYCLSLNPSSMFVGGVNSEVWSFGDATWQRRSIESGPASTTPGGKYALLYRNDSSIGSSILDLRTLSEVWSGETYPSSLPTADPWFEFPRGEEWGHSEIWRLGSALPYPPFTTSFSPDLGGGVIVNDDSTRSNSFAVRGVILNARENSVWVDMRP